MAESRLGWKNKKQKQYMKMRLLFIAILLLVLPASSEDVNSGSLEGCPDSDMITTALVKLHNTNWRELTLEQLWEIWPTELAYRECDPGGCKTVESQDRIIIERAIKFSSSRFPRITPTESPTDQTKSPKVFHVLTFVQHHILHSSMKYPHPVSEGFLR